MDIPAAANALGTIGAVCWSVQLIPQIIINYRRHHATGLQPSMMILWAWAGIPLGVYNIERDFNVALRIQPQILTVLSLVTWIQCFYYQRSWTVRKALAVVLPLAMCMGGIQAGLIFGLQAAKERKIEWPLTLMAVLAAVLLAAGVSAHYVDIYRNRTVRGISFLFVGIDAAGDLFSLLAVFFQPELDVLGLVIYATELVLWIGVMFCGVYYNLYLPHFKKRHEVEEAQRAESRVSQQAAGIALHDLGSSTSVFRTQSGLLAALPLNTSSKTGAKPEARLSRTRNYPRGNHICLSEH